jgi:hypothetical protein
MISWEDLIELTCVLPDQILRRPSQADVQNLPDEPIALMQFIGPLCALSL